MGLSSNMFTQGQRVKLWGVMPEAFVKANITCLTVGQDRTAERGRACSRGSVRARASKYSLCSRTCGNVPSRGFQDGQHRHGAAEEVESAAIGGHVVVVAGARGEKVAEFIVSPAEPGGRSGAFEAPHGSIADGLMTEHDAAHGEHLGQVAQAQLVAQATLLQGSHGWHPGLDRGSRAALRLTRDAR